jgi:hypothetical protein
MRTTFDAPPLRLTAGDPGPFPWPPDQPPCWSDCGCGRAADEPASGASAQAVEDASPADVFCDLVERSCPQPDVPPAAATGTPRPADAAADPALGQPVDWALPGVARPAAAPSPLLSSLLSALDELAAHGPLSGSRADTTALLRAAERTRALALREVAEMDAVGGHQRPGITSTTASWVRDSRHLTDGAARGTVHLAVALRDELPQIGQLLLAGTITVEHAAAVRDGLRGLDTDLIGKAADAIAQLAVCTDPVDLRTRLRDKAHAIDDRLAAQAERRARARMGLRLSDVGSHTALDGTLPAEDGATVRLAMDLAIEADRTRLTDGQTRSTAARQAEVLIGWATDYLHRTHGPGDSLADDAHTVRTHLHILCHPDQLTHTPDRASNDSGGGLSCTGGGPQASPGSAGSTSGAGGPLTLAELLWQDLHGAPPAAPGIAGDLGSLSRAALRRLACDATIDLVTLPAVPAVTGKHDGSPGRHRLSPFGTASTDPIDVGRSRRTVTGRLFRALITRDRHCIVKGCRRRPAQCAAHHVQHWADGGPTDLPNLVLLCHQHHHDHHDRGHDLPHHDGHRWLTQTGWRHAAP